MCTIDPTTTNMEIHYQDVARVSLSSIAECPNSSAPKPFLYTPRSCRVHVSRTIIALLSSNHSSVHEQRTTFVTSGAIRAKILHHL